MSQENTYFGVKYSKITSQGIRLGKKIIPISEVKFWKQHQNQSDLTPEVFGCEAVDNANDAKATWFEMKFRDMRENGKYSIIEYRDNGNIMSNEDLIGRFSLTPERRFRYDVDSIGCRGGGGKIEDNKEGFRKSFRQLKKGSQDTLELTIYIPQNFEDKDLIIDNLDKNLFVEQVKDVRQEIWEVPMDWFLDENDALHCKSKEVYLWTDSFKLDAEVIIDFMSRRYAQVPKFEIYVNDDIGSHNLERKPVFFRSLDKMGSPISDLKQIPLYSDKIYTVKGRSFKIRSHFRLSRKWDKVAHNQWAKKVKQVSGIENKQLIQDLGFKYDQPLLQIYDNNRLHLHTGARGDFWSKWKSSDRQNLEIIVEFVDNIQDKTSLIKSQGFSDDEFYKGIVEKVHEVINNDKTGRFISPHRQKIIQNERPEVEQFRKTIQENSGDGMALRLSFNGLNSNWTMEDLEQRKNWFGSKVLGVPGREIDCRFKPEDKPGIWFEFQSDKNDYSHFDGINSRAMLLNVDSKDYDTIIWVSNKFDSMYEEFSTLWKRINWGDTNLSYIHMITTEQLGLVEGKPAGFTPNSIITIDVQDIIKSSSQE
jgi:hypothetical protein